jgi:hypothetical protein
MCSARKVVKAGSPGPAKTRTTNALYLYSPARRNPLRRANATGTAQRRYAGLEVQDYRSEPGQSPWHANEAWCERVTLPPSASLAAISLACARKACSRSSAMAAIGRPSARWHERDVIERDLAIASGMLVHQITERVTALMSKSISHHLDQQGTGIGGGKSFRFFIIPLRHAASRTIIFDHGRSLNPGPL